MELQCQRLFRGPAYRCRIFICGLRGICCAHRHHASLALTYLPLQSTTEEAAKDIAAFVSIFFENFSKFKGRPFHMAGESYGVSDVSWLKPYGANFGNTGPIHPRFCSRGLRPERETRRSRNDAYQLSLHHDWYGRSVAHFTFQPLKIV